MKTKTIALATLLAAVSLTPALAQGDACIRPTRIFSTEPIDNRTILITDRSRNQYTIHMNGTCVGMDRSTSALVFQYQGTELSCLRRGDRISYRIGDSPHQTCYIGGVTFGAPPNASAAPATPAG
jgi:hypothetical protein